MTNVTLTAEQAQQIEEALSPYAYQYVEMGAAYTVTKSDALVERALTILRAARAQEQAEKEPLMDYERINALREGEQNGAEDAYFFVRPENDTPSLRKMFCQGFERGFHKGLKYASHVRTKDLTDAELNKLLDYWSEGERSAYGGAWSADGEYVDMKSFARAVIAKFKEKNK